MLLLGSFREHSGSHPRPLASRQYLFCMKNLLGWLRLGWLKIT